MADWVFFNDFAEQLGLGVHQLAAHNFKLALTNSAPALTDTGLADITQIAAGNGYVAGGYDLANEAVNASGNDASWDWDDLVIAASGGDIGPFRYAVIYNDSATSPADALVAYGDVGQTTIADGGSRTIRLDAAGMFTLTVA